jgi:hypothetical protein
MIWHGGNPCPERPPLYVRRLARIAALVNEKAASPASLGEGLAAWI